MKQDDTRILEAPRPPWVRRISAHLWPACRDGARAAATFVLLTLAYFLVILPVGLLLRLAGRDILQGRCMRAPSPAWRTREPRPFLPKRCERRY